MAKKRTHHRVTVTRGPLKKKAVRVKQTVALVRRAPKLPPIPMAVDAQSTPFASRVVTDGFALDTIGLVTLKTDERQEKILSREPTDAQISVLPDGALYCSHPVYTLWLNEAFGRGGWSIVPVSKPALIEQTVVVKYMLYVDGKPIALADGKQEYHPSNRNQDYGDVLEATRSNALRRLAKHLGIALQLWDRRWCAAWKRQHALAVTVMGRKKNDDGQWVNAELTQWRRKDDEPLKGEQRTGRAPRNEPAREEHSKLDEVISQEKRLRFWRIAQRVGRNEHDIKLWLKACYRIDRTESIKNRDYDAIVKVLEGPGPLPTMPVADGVVREPGEEG